MHVLAGTGLARHFCKHLTSHRAVSCISSPQALRDQPGAALPHPHPAHDGGHARRVLHRLLPADPQPALLLLRPRERGVRVLAVPCRHLLAGRLGMFHASACHLVCLIYCALIFPPTCTQTRRRTRPTCWRHLRPRGRLRPLPRRRPLPKASTWLRGSCNPRLLTRLLLLTIGSGEAYHSMCSICLYLFECVS